MRSRSGSRRGVALVVVLLVVMAVAAIASGAAFLGLNTQLIAKYHNRLSLLESVADAGLEQARSALNASKTLYPDTGYVTYENSVAVTDASGSTIPGVTRSTYVGPTGITSGQYGVFGSIVTVVQDGNGNRIVRRAEGVQESFAKFAYFTDVEGSIVFGKNDVLYGPVFSNDNIQLEAAAAGTGATFFGTLKTAGTITNRSSGDYKATPQYMEKVPKVPFPTVADLNKLKTQATIGGTALTSSTSGTEGQATMRIEFVAVDLNGDGNTTGDDEGFMKVYKLNSVTNAGLVWLVADTATDYAAKGVQNSANCGHILTSGTGNHAAFKTFKSHTGTSNTSDQKPWAVNNGTSKYCYLGGSDILNDATTPPGKFQANDGVGSWQPWTGTVDPRVTAARPADAAYLWPISRALNPNFKGVIHVTGKVAISGVVRGKLTLAATGNIIIADNIKYVTDPGGTVPCNSNTRDILGLFSGNDIIVANNMINAPWGITKAGAERTWAARSSDEFIHSVVLALSNFTVESYGDGSTSAEKCEGANAGRGCLYLTGGIIQNTRGAVGLTDGHGYIKRYQYDACAGMNPPPYFPTTGRFARGHYYEVEPTNFNIATYWNTLVP